MSGTCARTLFAIIRSACFSLLIRFFAKFDPRQIGDSRLSSVQYIKFDTKGKLPISIGSDFNSFKGETALTLEQKKALADDLK